MTYSKTIEGIFLERPNRFIAKVKIEDEICTVHVKNTGRCKELLIPGCKVILEDFRNNPDSQNRKTKFDLIAVYKYIEENHPLSQFSQNQNLLINMDSQSPNKVVQEWLETLPSDKKYDLVKPEFTFGNSRIDFYMEKGNEKFLMEVKGCTLERDGQGFFPDAPTERGVKHLYELSEAVKNGYNAILAFVIQIPGVTSVLPNIQTHPAFGQALDHAKSAGVKVLYLQCDVKEDQLLIKQL